MASDHRMNDRTDDPNQGPEWTPNANKEDTEAPDRRVDRAVAPDLLAKEDPARGGLAPWDQENVRRRREEKRPNGGLEDAHPPAWAFDPSQQDPESAHGRLAGAAAKDCRELGVNPGLGATADQQDAQRLDTARRGRRRRSHWANEAAPYRRAAANAKIGDDQGADRRLTSRIAKDVREQDMRLAPWAGQLRSTCLEHDPWRLDARRRGDVAPRGPNNPNQRARRWTMDDANESDEQGTDRRVTGRMPKAAQEKRVCPGARTLLAGGANLAQDDNGPDRRVRRRVASNGMPQEAMNRPTSSARSAHMLDHNQPRGVGSGHRRRSAAAAARGCPQFYGRRRPDRIQRARDLIGQ